MIIANMPSLMCHDSQSVELLSKQKRYTKLRESSIYGEWVYLSKCRKSKKSKIIENPCETVVPTAYGLRTTDQWKYRAGRQISNYGE